MIRFENIEIKFGDRTIINRLNCEFGKGINIVYGPSGCGKSSLLELLFSNLSPSHGKVHIPPSTSFSYCGNHGSMFYERDLLWNLLHLLGINGLTPRLSDLAKALNAENLLHTKINTLSGGERKKIELLFCFSKQADVYVLDEPTAGLDDQSKKALLGYLEEIRWQACFIIASHAPLEGLAPDVMVALRNGEGVVFGLAKEPICPAMAQPHKIGFFDCLRHFFARRLGLNIFEAVSSFLFVCSLLLFTSIIPPSREEQERIAAYNDPYPELLFSGTVDGLDYESFVGYARDSEFLALPFVTATDDNYDETGGYLINYDGDEFLLFQKNDGLNGFNLSQGFSYSDEGVTVENKFRFVEEDDKELDFLRPYRLFQKVLSSENAAILLCPNECFAPVVVSLSNGDFHSNNAIDQGNGTIAALPPLSLAKLSYSTWEIDEIGFSPLYGGEIEVIDEADYFLSLPGGSGKVNLLTSSATLSCVEGEGKVSIGAYCYLLTCAGSLRLYSQPLGYMGFPKSSLNAIDFSELFSPYTIGYNKDALYVERMIFLVLAIGFSLAYLIVIATSLSSKKNDDLLFILKISGLQKKKANGKYAILCSVCPTINLIIGYILYFACFIPVFNSKQALVDYPNGYGNLGALYEGMRELPFYNPNWLALIPLAILLISLAKAAIDIRKSQNKTHI